MESTQPVYCSQQRTGLRAALLSAERLLQLLLQLLGQLNVPLAFLVIPRFKYDSLGLPDKLRAQGSLPWAHHVANWGQSWKTSQPTGVAWKTG